MSWNWPTIHVSEQAMLTLITDKSALNFPVFPGEIPSFESGCSSHPCLVYWSVKEMYQDFAKSQPYEVYVDVGVPKCQSTILETNSDFTASLHLKGPKDHLQCFPLFVWMGAMYGLKKLMNMYPTVVHEGLLDVHSLGLISPRFWKNNFPYKQSLLQGRWILG